ncbi:Kinase [Hexamita inflata]|uniref:CAMK CAMK1 n=1 Tax=Hexamita inflata TaxID=28002 RepID=A0AA86PM97_9EUKA|nr:CAMK CAMK1 [Hexamita inflata]
MIEIANQKVFTLSDIRHNSDIRHDFIMRYMEINPKKRPTAVQLMTHKWFTDAEIDFELADTQDNLKEYLAKLKLKVSFQAVRIGIALSSDIGQKWAESGFMAVNHLKQKKE